MPNNKRVLVVVAALLAVVLVGGIVAYRTLAPQQQAAESSAAAAAAASAADASESADDTARLADYDATIYTEQNVPVTLTQLAKDKPLVLNFWATWCPYCIQEMGDYAQLYHRYGDQVSFAFVDCNYGGRGETAEGARAWLDENGYGDLPLYLDTDSAASMSLGASSLPTTVVVSADGKIVHGTAGAITYGKMDALLSSLVKA